MELIVCEIPKMDLESYLHPETGALQFIGSYHPDHMVRVQALADVLNNYSEYLI